SLQALMPPWAQTLCERLTGTMENRSTGTPSSASLMVAASPASPPPTTITRFLVAAAICSCPFPVRFSPAARCSSPARRPCSLLVSGLQPSALGLDEAYVMLQVLDRMGHQIEHAHRSGDVVYAL